MSDWNTPLTLTAVSANSTVELVIGAGSPTVSGLQYRTSTTATWETYPIGTENAEITLANVGDYVQFQNTEGALSTPTGNYVKFVMSGKIAGSGNVQALLNYSTSCTAQCFINLFYGCSSLYAAPELLADTLDTECYRSMFEGCSNLSSAPTIAATHISTRCYLAMFKDCVALTTPPILNATRLFSGCYQGMFQNCSSLVTAPELPATTLAESCYRVMFSGCSTLAVMPDLPATTLSATCYYEMFHNCTSLTTVGAVSATTLASSCCQSMFAGCSALQVAPTLHAKTLVTGCYYNMFARCSSLANVSVEFTSWLSGATDNWLSGVSSTGNFYKPAGLPETRGVSNIPTNWTLKSEYKPLTLTAVAAGSTVQLTKTGSPTVGGLQYRTSTSDTWSSYAIDTVVTLTNVGDYVQFQNTESTLSSGTTNLVQFVTSGSLAASGNIQALLNYSESCNLYCYISLFYNCKALTSTPDFPALTLATGCYQNTFEGCSNITTTCSTLPATTLATQCYLGMYRGCSSLTATPTLPATTLTPSCYYAMFQNCAALTEAPVLPAMTMASSCYYYMFSGCRGLTSTPELPATTLADSCYRGMFNLCSYLVNAKTLPAETLANSCYYQMFDSCVRLESAPEMLFTTPASWACYRMFSGCSTLSSVSVHFTSWHANATQEWLNGVSSTGNFYKPNALSDVRGVNNIPTNWTTKSEYKPLTLTAKEANSTVKITKTGSPTVSGLRYRTSTSSDWTSYTIDDVITLANVDDYVQFENTEDTLSTSYNDYAQFVMTGAIAGSGNIQALINYYTLTKSYCYYCLFKECSSLTTPPDLPADHFFYACYSEMFFGCTSLVHPPVIPASRDYLDTRCFMNMFTYCSSLVDAPELNSLMLGTSCYQGMFAYCNSLVKVQEELPATRLTLNCYFQMFSACGALSRAPRLPAQALVNGGICYRQMFQSTAVSEINVAFKSWDTSVSPTSTSNATFQWVTGVAAKGTFYKPMALPEEYGVSRIPEGWDVINVDAIECSPGLPTLMDPLGVTVKEEVPLTLTATQNNSTVKLTATGSPTTAGLHYRLGTSGKWLPYTIDSTINLNSGDSVQFWNSAETLSSSGAVHCTFALTGSINASGKIESLLNWLDYCSTGCFTNLFQNCTTLLTPPEFSAYILATRCYRSMFSGCTGLLYSPKLPAMILAQQCYEEMFNGCTHLAEAYDLPATTLQQACYNTMYASCSALKRSPKLPATSLATNCYSAMLWYSGVTHVDVSFTAWDNNTASWLNGVPASGVFIKPSALPEEYGNGKIPTGWTVINKD